MTKVNTTQLIIALIVIGLIAIFLLRECGHKAPPVEQKVKIDTSYITVRDTVRESIPIPYQVIKEGKPYMVTRLDTQFITVSQLVDTVTIMQDYFAKRYYRDTAKTAYGNVYISDTITQNKIRHRQVFTDWKIPEIHSVAPAPPKSQVYIGINASSNGQKLGFGPEFTLKTKRDHMYTLGADYLPGVDKPIFYRIGSKWKIHF